MRRQTEEIPLDPFPSKEGRGDSAPGLGSLSHGNVMISTITLSCSSRTVRSVSGVLHLTKPETCAKDWDLGSKKPARTNEWSTG